jgi:hypothetical protein
MNHPRQEFFAGSGFSENEYRTTRARSQGGLLKSIHKCRCFAEESFFGTLGLTHPSKFDACFTQANMRTWSDLAEANPHSVDPCAVFASMVTEIPGALGTQEGAMTARRVGVLYDNIAALICANEQFSFVGIDSVVETVVYIDKRNLVGALESVMG